MLDFFKVRNPKKFKMNWILNFFVIILAVLGIWTLEVYILFLKEWQEAWLKFFQEPAIIFLNIMPIFVVLIVLFAILKNIFYSTSLTTLFFGFLSWINLLKIENRDDPLLPSDISLIREAMVATGEYSLNLHWEIVFLTIGMAVILFGLGWFSKSCNRNKWYRISIAVFAVAIFIACMIGVYPNQAKVNGYLMMSNPYHMTSVCKTLGFNYYYLHNYNLYSVTEPDGYKKNKVEKWNKEYLLEAESPLPVNIVFVQGEAFTDLANDDAFNYNSSNNPLAKYNQLADSDNAISGRIIVPNFAAGTANTEFDVLTQMMTSTINESSSSALRAVNKEIDSFPGLLKDNGYNSFFLHPGDDWFYKRSIAYDFLGISDQIWRDAFMEEDYIGYHVSDEAFLREFEEKLTESFMAEEPVFAMGVTIQNHQFYEYENIDETPEKARVKNDITDKTMEAISVYMYGLRDTSEMVYQLANYLDTVNEPTILVFWGDHLPNLGNEYESYQELGLAVNGGGNIEENLNSLSTPYLLWANDAYCAENDFNAQIEALDLPKDNYISAVYLSNLIYEMLGFTGQDAYFDYLTTARRMLPVMSYGNYYLPDGTYTESLTAEQEEVTQKIHWWQYYRLTEGKKN